MRTKWNKKKTVDPAEEGVISFIPTGADIYLKPVRGSEFIPEWYKKMPAKARLRPMDREDDLTIKRCIPVLDAITTGYFLVTTEDYVFEKGENEGEYRWSSRDMNVKDDGSKKVTMHPVTQVSTMPFSPEFLQYAFKWNSPWIIKTPPGYSCIYTHPFNSQYLPFKSLDGVVDTDTYFQPVLFPFLMKNNFDGVIPAGTPVIQIIPFKRDDWKMEIVEKVPGELLHDLKHRSDQYESQRYDSKGKPIGGIYKRDYRKKKKYL